MKCETFQHSLYFLAGRFSAILKYCHEKQPANTN